MKEVGSYLPVTLSPSLQDKSYPRFSPLSHEANTNTRKIAVYSVHSYTKAENCNGFIQFLAFFILSSFLDFLNLHYLPTNIVWIGHLSVFTFAPNAFMFGIHQLAFNSYLCIFLGVVNHMAVYLCAEKSESLTIFSQVFSNLRHLRHPNH